jgi:hypothetical protein
MLVDQEHFFRKELCFQGSNDLNCHGEQSCSRGENNLKSLLGEQSCSQMSKDLNCSMGFKLLLPKEMIIPQEKKGLSCSLA